MLAVPRKTQTESCDSEFPLPLLDSTAQKFQAMFVQLLGERQHRAQNVVGSGRILPRTLFRTISRERRTLMAQTRAGSSPGIVDTCGRLVTGLLKLQSWTFTASQDPTRPQGFELTLPRVSLVLEHTFVFRALPRAFDKILTVPPRATLHVIGWLTAWKSLLVAAARNTSAIIQLSHTRLATPGARPPLWRERAMRWR